MPHLDTPRAPSLDALPLPPAHLAWLSGPEAEGIETPRTLGGVVIQPAATIMGLRGWEDCFEGTTERAGATVAWSCFDLEKIIRMALHQSGLAVELLGSPAVAGLWCEDTPARPGWIIEQAITRDIARHYLDTTSAGVRALRDASGPSLSAARALRLVRVCLTGVWLTHHAEVVLDLDALCARLNVDDTSLALLEPLRAATPAAALDQPTREALADLLDAHRAHIRHEDAALPARVTGYDALNAFLVEARQSATPPSL